MDKYSESSQSENLNKRRKLRRESTIAEKNPWKRLRNRNLGYKFRRQHNVGYYIADFYCARLLLAVEIDGDIHLLKEHLEYDKERDRVFQSKGVTVFRFTNDRVMNEIDNVCSEIVAVCCEMGRPHPLAPSPASGEGEQEYTMLSPLS